MALIVRKPLVAGLALLGVGAAAALFWPRPAAHISAPTQPQPTHERPRADIAPPSATEGSDLPWMNAPAAPAMPVSGQGVPARTQSELSAVRAQQQQMVTNIDRQAANNLQALDELEKQFEQLESSGQVPAGVDVQKVRQNLRLVRRTQELSRELGSIVIREPSPEKTERMRQIGDELLMLQTQMQLLNPTQFAGKP